MGVGVRSFNGCRGRVGEFELKSRLSSPRDTGSFNLDLDGGEVNNGSNSKFRFSRCFNMGGGDFSTTISKLCVTDSVRAETNKAANMTLLCVQNKNIPDKLLLIRTSFTYSSNQQNAFYTADDFDP